MNIILYTAGSHGRFLKFLFECHIRKEILPTSFNINGNSHDHTLSNSNSVEKNLALDICHNMQDKTWKNIPDSNQKIYSIVWNGLEEFYYIVQAFTDRGGTIKSSGIEMMERDIKQYEKSYGVDVHITKSLNEHFNFDCDKLGQPPRSVLRNYFLLSFFTYFEHICWIKNEELLKLNHKNYQIITLNQLLNYESLQNFFIKNFKITLDFRDVHKEFLDNNSPLKQLSKVRQILDAINNEKKFEIAGLNVISEAYILFVLECKHFDIPFLLGDKFFNNTEEFSNFIKYFPNSMKKPNNLFHKYFKNFRRSEEL